MKSMTGFGLAARSTDDLDVSAEVKSVNSRYLDVHPRLPRELSSLEGDLRRAVGSRLARGRVDLFLTVTVRRSDQHRLDEAVVEGYLSMAEKLRERGVEGKLGVEQLLALPGVLLPVTFDARADEIRSAILEALDDAVEQVVRSRQDEGAALKVDLEARIKRLEQTVQSITAESEGALEHYRERLQRRIDELSLQAVDENRLAQETVYHAERSDTSEELTRLLSHISRFKELLNGSDAVGRRLDFLCQEMGREMNTVLSKAHLASISELAVEGKSEVEKIREQVQNVE